MKTPDYVLTDPVEYGPFNDRKTIDAGTFVRPIEDRYVPLHCFDDPYAKHYNKETEVFCYTPRNGIIPLPLNCIRRI